MRPAAERHLSLNQQHLQADIWHMQWRADPREVRPQDAIFCRNLGLLALGGALYVAVTLAASPWRASFADGLHLSLAVSLSVGGAYLFWASRFIVRHIAQGTAFFRANDDRFRGLTNALFFVVGPVLLLGGVAMYLHGSQFTSGLAVCPGGLLSLFGFARATGGIQRL